MIERLKKIQQHKYFEPIMTAVLCLLPFLAFLCMWDEVADHYPAPLSSVSHNMWPTVILTILWIVGLYWFGRVISFRTVARGLSHALVVLYPFILYFCLEWMCFGNLFTTLRFFFINHYYMMFFMVALLTALFWVLNVIWRRYWISATVMSVVVMIMGYINIAKMGINGEPFLPTDMAFAGNIGDLTGFAAGSLPFTKELVFGALILIAVSVIFFFGKQKSFKNYWLRPVLALVCLAFVGVTVVIPSVKDFIFLGDSIMMSRQYTQKVVYENHGFMGGFLINIEGYVPSPEGYDKEYITELIASYESEEDGSDFEKPDVIVYLAESMFDVTKVPGVKLTMDPLENLHKIQSEHLSGTMTQASGVGGGTVRSEFEVLTGINLVDMKEGLIPYNTYVPKSQKQVYGLPNYFKNMGYKTVGVHSYKESFYSRNTCYGKMGFDEFIGAESMVDPVIGDNARGFIVDSYFVEQIEAQLEKDPEQNKFIFAISMENHGGFTNKYETYDEVITHENWDEKETSIANNYCKSANFADDALGQLYEYVQKREKPTVVLYFGDHLPTLNDRHTVLESAEYISTGWSSNWTTEDQYNMYRTPFVIFSNYIDETPKDVGHYSSYMLPSLLLDYMDAPKNGYWNLISAFHDEISTYNRFITIDREGTIHSTQETDSNGEVISSILPSLDPKAQQLIDAHTMISYDALAGKRYINDLLLENE